MGVGGRVAQEARSYETRNGQNEFAESRAARQANSVIGAAPLGKGLCPSTPLATLKGQSPDQKQTSFLEQAFWHYTFSQGVIIITALIITNSGVRLN